MDFKDTIAVLKMAYSKATVTIKRCAYNDFDHKVQPLTSTKEDVDKILGFEDGEFGIGLELFSPTGVCISSFSDLVPFRKGIRVRLLGDYFSDGANEATVYLGVYNVIEGSQHFKCDDGDNPTEVTFEIQKI